MHCWLNGCPWQNFLLLAEPECTETLFVWSYSRAPLWPSPFLRVSSLPGFFQKVTIRLPNGLGWATCISKSHMSTLFTNQRGAIVQWSLAGFIGISGYSLRLRHFSSCSLDSPRKPVRGIALDLGGAQISLCASFCATTPEPESEGTPLYPNRMTTLNIPQSCEYSIPQILLIGNWTTY